VVDSVDDGGAAAAAAEGAYTVRTDLGEIGRTHNYRSDSGAERIAATVNRFDRYYTHDIVIAVPDDLPELQPFYIQALMYALATTDVGIATLVSPLENRDLENDEIAKVAVNWNPDRIVYLGSSHQRRNISKIWFGNRHGERLNRMTTRTGCPA
jgi:CMP-2-keto-3-deoxyoctulosonic acid synthetase